ncbi:MAG: MoaD/ThiS family protein [Dehalococcoidales bacterium]|nr:MoaD/ThiS family protein [Dehalococcoidales bacterium]
MSVEVHIHPYLKHLADNNEKYTAEGTTVGECLEDMVKKYPALDEWIFNEDRSLKPMFEVYLNMTAIVPEGPAMPVKNGDRINLVITIAGG